MNYRIVKETHKNGNVHYCIQEDITILGIHIPFSWHYHISYVFGYAHINEYDDLESAEFDVKCLNNCVVDKEVIEYEKGKTKED